MATKLFLEILFGPNETTGRNITAILPILLLAFSKPFWYHAIVAEVYTLHAFFTCLIFLLLLQWKLKQDVRFLYATAFIYGLSAGNHGTVVFYLPAIMFLLFAWGNKSRYKNLIVSSLIFLIAFSVYLYLPIRSLSEPTIDWGNPETLKEFLYHVTDRQHANTHFDQLPSEKSNDETYLSINLSLLWTSTYHVLKSVVLDLNKQLTTIAVVGFFFGAFLCFKASRSLFFFFFLIIAINASFFVGWKGESYIPIHIVACLWTSAFLCWVTQRNFKKGNEFSDLNSTTYKETEYWHPKNKLIFIFMLGCVAWLVSNNYYRVNRSNNYFADSMLKRMILSLDDSSIFVSGISWFHSAYHQDVTRLRDDVTYLKAWDFLDVNPPTYISTKRYPDLLIPVQKNHQFDSRTGSFLYMIELFDRNSKRRPLLIEQNNHFLKQFPLAKNLVPHNNLLLRYSQLENGLENKNPGKGFEEYKSWLEEELALPGIQNELAWINKVSYYIPSFAAYFHSNGYYKEERDALLVMREFLGQGGVIWFLKMIENLLQDGKLELAKINWTRMAKKFPDVFATHLAEGMLFNKEDKWEKALISFKRASEKNPKSFRPFLESAKTRIKLGKLADAQQSLTKAKSRVKSLVELKKVENKILDLRSLQVRIKIEKY